MLDKLINFLDSNFFTAFIALLVGLSAFILYKKQQRDRLRTAALIILMDIEDISETLRIAKSKMLKGESLTEGELNSLGNLSCATWNAEKHQLLRVSYLSPRLENHHFDTIDNFFRGAKLIQTGAKRAIDFGDHQLVSKASAIQGALVDVAKDAANKEDESIGSNEYSEKISRFTKLFENEPYLFNAASINISLKNALLSMEDISVLPCVEKLRKIANL